MNQFLSFIELIGKQATAQLSGPKAWLYALLYKAVIFLLDYFKTKHELKKEFQAKLEAYEKSKLDQNLTKEKKDEALDDFLK